MKLSAARRDWLLAIVLLLWASGVRALPTPTPTPPAITPPGATVSATPTPRPRATIFPNPARSGQRVTLDASETVTVFSPQWSQIAGDVAVAIDDADSFVASFIAPAVSAPATVRVQFALLSSTVISTLEFDVTILPADVIAVSIGDATGPPGGIANVEVTLDPIGLAVRDVRHELSFEPEAAVADRGDGTPDCESDHEASTFAFVPSGCAATESCTGVRAEVVAAEPILAPAVIYRCRLAVTYDPLADSCTHALRCAGGEASTLDGMPLALACTDGSVTSAFQYTEPAFSLRVDPPQPVVGDTVRLTFSVSAVGGIAQYHLAGIWPLLSGETTAHTNTFGDVAFTLHADRAGTALLQLDVNYEVAGGCPGHQFFFFRSAISSHFELALADPTGRRVAGHVAEFPLGCQGAMRGVTVTLEPGGFTTQTDLAAGQFVFDGVSPGDYALTVSPACNPFGCWPVHEVHVGDEDVSLTVCPRLRTCIGDCNGNGMVTIDELIAGVQMALDATLSAACAAFDADQSGAVQIAELVGAVESALVGCDREPGVTPSPTATPMPTP